MESLQSILFIIQIIISVLLVIIILVQRSGEDALSGIGGGAGNKSVITQKAATDIVTKITMILVIVFMINCLFLAVISARSVNKDKMIIDKYIETEESGGKISPLDDVEIPD